jgi:hypothetical protein
MRSGYGAGFVLSILAFAAGAVLYWGITTTQTHGFRLSTLGVILMLVGGVGVLISAILVAVTQNPGRRSYDRQVIDPAGRESVVHEQMR